jgi:hypothetical protein
MFAHDINDVSGRDQFLYHTVDRHFILSSRQESDLAYVSGRRVEAR